MAFGFTRNKFKTIIFLICAAIIFIFVTTPNHNFSKDKHLIFEEIQRHIAPVDKDITLATTKQQQCPENLHIYYVKIHKTGSSTFQNILYRLGLKRDLSFALFKCAYGMTYPHPPKEEYLYSRPTIEGFKEYDFLTDHSMFNPDVYKSYMPNDTKVVTLLRHPLSQLQSTFGFWGLPAKFGIPSSENAIEAYLENPTKYEQTRSSFGCQPTVNLSQTRNPQSHHLGLQNQAEDNENVIDDLVKQLDETMYLVLILEQFEESLLLFKRMLCLNIQDILHLNLFSTSFFRRKTYGYNDTNEKHLLYQHRLWSPGDYIIYEHFTEKLNRKIEEQGIDFQNELQSFRETKQKVRTFCSESCEVFPTLINLEINDIKQKLNSESITISASRWSNEFSVSRADCVLMMFETLMYDDAIKAKQWPNACPGYTGPNAIRSGGGVPQVKSSYCDKTQHFVNNFSWEAVKKTPYFNKATCLENF